MSKKIKLLVELSQEEYEFLKDLIWVNTGRGNCKTIQKNVINAIKFGTPITEGDLISRSELIKTVEKGEGISWEHHNKDDMCVRKKYIDNAPAVVERPKGDTTDSCDMNFFEPEKHMRGDENGKS